MTNAAWSAPSTSTICCAPVSSDHAALAADLVERARRVRLVGFDVDGTLTDGRLVFDDAGRESKAFHVQDGLGLKLLEDAGIVVAIVTARESEAAKARARDLKLKHVFTAVKDKRACLDRKSTRLNSSHSQT